MAEPVLQGNLSGRNAIYRLVDGAGASGIDADGRGGVPTDDSVGLDLAAVSAGFPFEDSAVVRLWKRGGTGVSLQGPKLVGYGGGRPAGGPAAWGPVGTGADAARGKLNGAAAIGTVSGYDVLLYQEIGGLWFLDRVALVLGTIDGSDVDVVADLILRRRG